jgi:hypothetical protein
VARSKPRKAVQARVAQERRARHQENRARKPGRGALWDLAHRVVLDNPPEVEASGRSSEEVSEGFAGDPAAPMIILLLPRPEPDGRVHPARIQLVVNDRRVARELETRGLKARQPCWDEALGLTRQTAMEVAERVLRRILLDPG